MSAALIAQLQARAGHFDTPIAAVHQRCLDAAGGAQQNVTGNRAAFILTAGADALADADIALAARYVRRMLDVFAEFDMTAAFSGNWMSLRDLMVARLTVAEIFIQTPGPQAGQMAGTVR